MTINEQTQIDTADKVLAFAFPQQAVAKGHLRVPGQGRPANVVTMSIPETEETGRAIAEKLARFKASL